MREGVKELTVTLERPQRTRRRVEPRTQASQWAAVDSHIVAPVLARLGDFLKVPSESYRGRFEEAFKLAAEQLSSHAEREGLWIIISSQGRLDDEYTTYLHRLVHRS